MPSKTPTKYFRKIVCMVLFVIALFLRRWCTSTLLAVDWRALSLTPLSAHPEARPSACWRRLTLASPRLPQESSHEQKRRSPARWVSFPRQELRGTSRRCWRDRTPMPHDVVAVLERGSIELENNHVCHCVLYTIWGTYPHHPLFLLPADRLPKFRSQSW